MEDPGWQPRRLTAVAAVLPKGVTPPGTRGRILHAGLWFDPGQSTREQVADANVEFALRMAGARP